MGWKGSLWCRRYDGILVSCEPRAQWNRLAYVLANGTKEGLVESPLEWPDLLKQRPFERPTVKKPKRSPKPRFHAASKEVLDELPPGCFPPALAFIGPAPPPRPPRPPTRTITVLESGVVERGPIPVIVIPKRWLAVEPRARGQPP